MSARLSLPLLKQHLYGASGLALLIALYLLPGTLGHTPWRGDDIDAFATVHALLQGEWFLFPHMAGEPVSHYGPLHYWLSGAFALLLGWLLPVHDAARLATPFAAILATFWISRTASRLYGRHTRAAAALLTIGTLGLALHVHENQPMVTLMAAQALTLAGLSLVPVRPLQGSLQAALGVVLAFLAAGPLGMLLTLPLMFVVAFGIPKQRSSPRASGALILGLTLALGLCALWPASMALQQPALLDWWWAHAWGDLSAGSLSSTSLPRTLELLGWTVWPLWPIALWALWKARRQLLQLQWRLPLAATVLACLWIYARGAGSSDSAILLPLLPPLALLAAAGVPILRRGAANAFDWFAVMSCSVFALLIWLAWTAQAFSWPPGLTRSLERMAPEFTLTGLLPQALIGAFIILVWLLLVWRLPRNPDRSPTNWALGLTMLWCLAVALLLPWFDHTRNYQPMAQSLASTLAKHEALCVATLGLATSHRAALDIHTGLRPIEANTETSCRFLIVQDNDFVPEQALTRQWREIWHYAHAGGKRLEIFRLYRRE